MRQLTVNCNSHAVDTEGKRFDTHLVFEASPLRGPVNTFKHVEVHNHQAINWDVDNTDLVEIRPYMCVVDDQTQKVQIYCICALLWRSSRSNSGLSFMAALIFEDSYYSHDVEFKWTKRLTKLGQPQGIVRRLL